MTPETKDLIKTLLGSDANLVLEKFNVEILDEDGLLQTINETIEKNKLTTTLDDGSTVTTKITFAEEVERPTSNLSNNVLQSYLLKMEELVKELSETTLDFQNPPSDFICCGTLLHLIQGPFTFTSQIQEIIVDENDMPVEAYTNADMYDTQMVSHLVRYLRCVNCYSVYKTKIDNIY